MLSDKDLVRQLRDAMASLHPRSDLVERVLEQAATPERRIHLRPGALRVGLRRVRPPSGSWAVLASCVVVIAVCGVALLLTSPHRDQAKRGTALARGAGRQLTPAQIVSELSVLRRPQTPADRAARPSCPSPCRTRYLPTMTRLARTLPDGRRVFLSVWRETTFQSSAPAGGYRVVAFVAAAAGVPRLNAQSLSSISVLVGDQLTVVPSADASSASPLWTAIVPDAVSHVRWTFGCRHRNCPDALRAPITIDVPAVKNVTAARVAQTAQQARVPTRVDWYDRRGHLLASFAIPTHQITPIPTLGVGRPQPSNAALIKAFLTDAQRGSRHAFRLTYDMTVPDGNGPARHVTVTAVQRSPTVFSYRLTPSLQLTRPGGPPAAHSVEIYDSSAPLSNAAAGLYSCTQTRPASRWSCQGPENGVIGMGGYNQLLGPYLRPRFCADCRTPPKPTPESRFHPRPNHSPRAWTTSQLHTGRCAVSRSLRAEASA